VLVVLKKVKIASAAILVIIALIIAFQNRESVDTKLLFATVTMPRAALLFITLVIGFTGGILTSWSLATRAKTQGSDAS